MVYKPTGRPPGRPKGTGKPLKPRELTPDQLADREARRLESQAKTAERAAIRRNLRAKRDLGLTDEQIDKIVPMEAWKLLMRHALKEGDIELAQKIARDWAPYIHPRIAERPLNVEELRRLADAARSEAADRGLDEALADRLVAGAMPH